MYEIVLLLHMQGNVLLKCKAALSRGWEKDMKSLWAVLILMISSAAVSAPANSRSVRSDEMTSAGCSQDANVDTCWRAGVQAEKLGNAEAALAAYEASCTAGFQVGGCYEAGKIYFLNPRLRDYGRSKAKMAQVCESDDVGVAPYACKYLGIIYQKGLSVTPRPERAFGYFAKACFPRGEPFIDGSGCELLGNHIPDANAMGVVGDLWQPDYIAYLAFAMGCSDRMPAQCNQAGVIHRRAVAQSADWLARCAEDAAAVQSLERCEDIVRLALADDYDTRQAFRRGMVRMFHRATDYAG
ncbi:SEL1-like repeat protein [Novosphingobium soli]|uniref:SEL1-like repeat protein n=1 Tax=Novosphingobium soli TaxID=574956 RepID=A0ABV6CZE3_9SPHN